MREGPLASKVQASSLVQKVEEKVQERAANQVKEEMEKHGKIVMNKAADSQVIVVADSRLQDLIKAKLAADPSLENTDIKQDVQQGDVALRQAPDPACDRPRTRPAPRRASSTGGRRSGRAQSLRTSASRESLLP